MAVDPRAVRLAAYFDREAEWREGVAREYPKDQRNLRSAAALHELARFVLETVDAPTLDWLEGMGWYLGEEYDCPFPFDVPRFPEVSRYGWDRPPDGRRSGRASRLADRCRDVFRYATAAQSTESGWGAAWPITGDPSATPRSVPALRRPRS